MKNSVLFIIVNIKWNVTILKLVCKIIESLAASGAELNLQLGILIKSE